MKTRILAISAVVLSLAFGLALTARGQPDAIITEGEDGKAVLSPTASGPLNSLIANIAPRLIVEAADGNREYAFVPAPANLLALAAQAADRLIIEAADENRLYLLSTAPAALLDLASQVADRLTLEAADANRFYGLEYPAALLNDNTAPTLSNIKVQTINEDSVTITWDTDEFADSQVQYGTVSTVYGETVSDSLYVIDHEIVISGLSEAETYYYIVVSVDQSGNARQSVERTFELKPDSDVFLPVLVR